MNEKQYDRHMKHLGELEKRQDESLRELMECQTVVIDVAAFRARFRAAQAAQQATA